MQSKTTTTVIILIFLLGIGLFFVMRGNTFEIPRGETTVFVEEETSEKNKTQGETSNIETTSMTEDSEIVSEGSAQMESKRRTASTRQVFITDGVKHSIPLNEILSGGPPKDGIPSIDDPKFVSVTEADTFLEDNSVGLGVVWKGVERFYPYLILVWHEIVNDTIAGDPILVTYCPLCATGVVFERRVNGEVQEFGVSGRLWQSNLLMYNRADSEDNESLWSQVLGEAVLGTATGQRLPIVRSDTVRYGDWKKEHPNTMILSRDTGALRNYGADPYGSYYTDTTVSFGATFNDDRLHPKDFVIGIELNGEFKAYHLDALPQGSMDDTFAGETLVIEKSNIDEVDIFVETASGKQEIETIDGFWFSWLAVHPDTLLFK